jgi:HSP20 family protein
MSLIKWEPLNELEAMVDKAFNWPVLRTASPLTLGEWAPKVDISESDGTYRFQADVPGMKKDDISVALVGDTLVIQGQRQHEQEEKKPHFHRLERSYGGFSRRFSLPDDADLNSVHAKCADGELIISIAKKDGALSPNTTQIQIE